MYTISKYVLIYRFVTIAVVAKNTIINNTIKLKLENLFFTLFLLNATK